MVYCSFCGKSQEEVQKIIAGNNAFICNECVELAQEIIREELAEEVLADLSEVPKPIELLHILNHYVIGQDRAKRALAVAVSARSIFSLYCSTINAFSFSHLVLSASAFAMAASASAFACAVAASSFSIRSCFN